MKKKYIPFLIAALVLIVAMASFIIVDHKNNSEDVSDSSETASLEEDPNDLTESDDFELEEGDEGNGIVFIEEEDDAVIERVQTDESKYYGEWEATSDMALYLYGNIDVTVNKDGTWKGNITGEELGGTYEYLGDHMHMTDSLAGIFDFDLAFDKGGNLILIDTDSDDEVNTVLTKKQ